jgi:exodeoxyribonuclease V beta subunit
MSTVSPQLIPLDAPALVEASAGTGKTYTITTYFVRAILEYDLMPEQILVVTYTKAATAELRVRARQRVLSAIAHLDGTSEDGDVLHGIVAGAVERLGRRGAEDRLRKALGRMDQASILTIHGLCQRLLQDHPLSFAIDFDFEVAEDVASMYADLAVDFWATDLYDKPDWLLRALQHHGVNVDHLAKLANVAMMPGIEVVGPMPSEVDDDALAQWWASREAAAALWTAERRRVVEILLHDKGLNRNSYRVSSIEGVWLHELDGFFRQTRFEYPPDFLPKVARGNMKMKKGFDEPTHPFFDACASLWEAHETLAPGFDYAVFALRQRFIEFARTHARKRQEDTAVLTFDDLLTTVYAPFDPSHARSEVFDTERIAQTILAEYPMALVDEFQDTDAVQYGIFRAIYGEGKVVYVGDPKQAIYAFRGADVFSYLGAVGDVAGRRYTLSENRRSDPGVVHAVNTLFSLREPPFILEGIDMPTAIPYHRESRSTFDPAMEVLFLGEQELKGPIAAAVAPIVANEIALLLGSDARIEKRRVEPGDIAVLCRSNNQAMAVTGALRGLNIPVSLDGDSSVLNTEIATDVRAVLEAALMPGDSQAARRALLTPLLGVSPYELATMTDELWAEWVSRFRNWNDTWHSQGVVRFLEDMLRSTGAEVSIASHPAARRKLTDLLHVEELLLRGERQRKRDPIALMQWFRRLDEDTRDDGAVAYEDLQQRPDAESGAVRVATIHKSKGLEFGIVYCPFTWNDAGLWPFEKIAVKFHDAHRNIKIDLGSQDRDAHLQASEEEAFSEALRLLYVAVTRAKHRCTLFWGHGPSWKKSALGYLLHGDEGLGKLDEDAMRKDLEALAASSSGSIACRPPHVQQCGPVEHEAPTDALTAQEPTRFFSHTARIASFTSLTGHDEKTPGPRGSASLADSTAALFTDLPGGVRTGLLLHSMLEHAKFHELGGDETRQLIERELRDFGLDVALAPLVQRDLQTVGATPLTNEPGAPRLIDLPETQQLRELEFTLCVGRPKLDELAALMQQHGSPAAAPRYYERLAEVGSPRLQEFLRGYIDLMFEWQGRWYVADYKSNTLPAYDAEAINEAVQREHYVLQGQLYSSAAQRHLRQRMADFDPERHWGGVMFLFLRGMRGAESAGASVFFDRQPTEFLTAVDHWLGGGDESR